MTLTQPLFEPTELRLVCYVDDPLAAMRGIPYDRRILAAILLIDCIALGFKFAFAVGQLNQTVTRIGGAFTIDAKGVKAVVKQSIVSMKTPSVSALRTLLQRRSFIL